MTGAYTVFGLSLVFQAHRWQSTPAYHVLLQIFTAHVWGALFLASGILMGFAAWQFERRRWAVIAALTLAAALTTGWMLAFVARYLSSPDTTPETWVSWAVFLFLLLRVAGALDRPRGIWLHEVPELPAYRQAVSDAITEAARAQQASVAGALDASAEGLRAAVAAACDAYGEALRAVVPGGTALPGDQARAAFDEARAALLRADEALARAAGMPGAVRSPPPPPS